MMPQLFAQRALPEGLNGIYDLALDLRWTWSEANSRLWQMLDAEAWERTSNPFLILQSVSQSRLEEAASDEQVQAELRGWLEQRRRLLVDPGWFGRAHPAGELKSVAYFSMEFGLSEALPIYSGGLGMLAGDHLKTASDLGVPIVGIGLLYQQGYFRQVIAADGEQLEAFPYNDPASLPITPARNQEGGWLRIDLELPGRNIFLRVWQAQVGKVTLYLLDSNDPLNSPWDRGITAQLYAAGRERRLIQEIVLGVGGVRVLQDLGIEADVFHLNEGHAAFAVIARAVGFMRRTRQSLPASIWATRAGNVFTTHTPVPAGFDRFEPALIKRYAERLAEMVGVSIEEVMAVGRKNPLDENEPFNMTHLALRGCAQVNAVSRLHGQVSRGMFAELFPGIPLDEVPVNHVTNGVHLPSWDSPLAQKLWARFCGEDYWLNLHGDSCLLIESVSDEELWGFRAAQRRDLIEYVRRRLMRQVRQQGAEAKTIQRASRTLDLDALTLGFARRFAAYKRPTLLLKDLARLERMLLDTFHPVQLIIAGKAHPDDKEGQAMVREVAQFASRPELFERVVFLEDYDMVLAQHLVAGVDIWLNTPRRPLEACGTSGMKVLVNGGLNLSELDGWWEEAYTPETGWALGDGREHTEPEWDAVEADQLYGILERQIIPEFYNRNRTGVPERWIERVRAGMSQLTYRFSSNRMMREYVEQAYLPAARAFRRRTSDGGGLAVELRQWQMKLRENWEGMRFGDVNVRREDDHWHFTARLYPGEMEQQMIRVELFAEPLNDEGPTIVVMSRQQPIAGAANGFAYTARVAASRPAEHYTARVVPFHPEAFLPLEEARILWQR
ncbi:MAG: alpha-glucan family phosphorylase [Blastocatellia bacterium]